MSEPSWPPPPIPVQALPYSQIPSRPGVITAVGVISIVLASISVLASAYLGLMCVLFWSMSKMSTAMATATPPTTTPTVISASGSSGVTTVTIPPTNTASPPVSPTPSATRPPPEVVEGIPSKLSAADHATILKAFMRLEALNAARRKQLDLLIGAGGDRMVPNDSGDPLTVDQVLASVSEHGQMPSADATIAGAHFFATDSGRMEIYDDHCVFYPGDGSDTVRFGSASVAGGAADPNSNTSAVADPTKLTPGELQGILNQAQSASQNKLTPKHLASLTSVLQAPNQPYATPGAKVPAVISAFVDQRGNASIYFYNGTVTIDGTGKVVNQFNASSTAGGFSGPIFSANRTACGLSVAGAVLGVALAIFLLVSGILMLKQSPRGRMLHLIYAGLKIPAAIGSAIGVMWMFGSFANSAAAAAAATPSAGPTSGTQNTGAFVFMSAILIVISCAYPIALLIVMNLRSTKQYYAPSTPA